MFVSGPIVASIKKFLNHLSLPLHASDGESQQVFPQSPPVKIIRPLTREADEDASREKEQEG